LGFWSFFCCSVYHGCLFLIVYNHTIWGYIWGHIYSFDKDVPPMKLTVLGINKVIKEVQVTGKYFSIIAA
jgi:hypothetical protein